MRIIKQSFSFMPGIHGHECLEFLEKCGRTCYKSEDKITPDSARYFVGKLILAGHTSVLEHVNVTVRIITNRGVSHELVRHRIASYSQESTRWCDYGIEGHITFILPVWLYGVPRISDEYTMWERHRLADEQHYFESRRMGWGPEKAREDLPNALKTEIVMTANLREWRLVFSQRCAKNAHPQMRALMQEMLVQFKEKFPIIFDDLYARIVCGL